MWQTTSSGTSTVSVTIITRNTSRYNAGRNKTTRLSPTYKPNKESFSLTTIRVVSGVCVDRSMTKLIPRQSSVSNRCSVVVLHTISCVRWCVESYHTAITNGNMNKTVVGFGFRYLSG